MYLHCIAIFSCPNPPFEAKNRKKSTRHARDYKVLAQGRKGYLNVPFIILVGVKQQNLVISDAVDIFDSFITSVTYKSPIKIYFLWQFSDYWS